MIDSEKTTADVLHEVAHLAEGITHDIHPDESREYVADYLRLLADTIAEAVDTLANSPADHEIRSILNSVGYAADQVAKGVARTSSIDGYYLASLSFADYTARPLLARVGRVDAHTQAGLRRLYNSFNRLGTLLVEVMPTYDVPAQNQRTAAQPGRTARKLMAMATRLLPAADRPRYTAEFRAELTDIATAGTRRAQFAYAVRLVIAAPRLRAELKAPRRRSASQ